MGGKESGRKVGRVNETVHSLLLRELVNVIIDEQTGT